MTTGYGSTSNPVMDWWRTIQQSPYGSGSVEDYGKFLNAYQTQNDLKRENDLFSQWQVGNNAFQPIQSNMFGWARGGNQPSWMNTGNAPNLQKPTGLQGTTMAALTSTPNSQDVYNRVLQAYTTLGNQNIGDTYDRRTQDVTRNFAGRGLMMPNTGTTNAAVGLENWRDKATAEMGAQGVLAALGQAANARQEAAGNATTLEGLLASILGQQNAVAQQGFQNSAQLRGEQGSNFFNLINSLLGQNNAMLGAASGVNPPQAPVYQQQQSQSWLGGLGNLLGAALGNPGIFK